MQHLAVIMDGNRRWAKQRNLSSADGHRKGRDAARLAVEFCVKNDIKYLSLYAFSLENFRRDEEEKAAIFSILVDGINAELDEFIERGVRICFVGDRSRFPEHLLSSIQHAEKSTKHLEKLQVNVLFCYGAQQELTSAMQTIARQVQQGELAPEDITKETIEKMLWTAGTPDPDLIVRTGYAPRLSNFMLYQAAYSELKFLDCYWPDITEKHLESCVQDFYKTKRNFGC